MPAPITDARTMALGPRVHLYRDPLAAPNIADYTWAFVKSSNSSWNKKFKNLPIVIYIRIAPPTLLPKRADVLPTLFRYELIINLVVRLFLAGGTWVSPIKPPTIKEQKYDGPIVAESFSVNMVTPCLSTFSNGLALPPPRYLIMIFCWSSRCAGIFAFGNEPSNPAPNYVGFLPKSYEPMLSTISLPVGIMMDGDALSESDLPNWLFTSASLYTPPDLFSSLGLLPPKPNIFLQLFTK